MPEKKLLFCGSATGPKRDQRVTTHVGLTARALGAQGMYLAASDKGVVAEHCGCYRSAGAGTSSARTT